jgi:hypothetical protein
VAYPRPRSAQVLSAGQVGERPGSFSSARGQAVPAPRRPHGAYERVPPANGTRHGLCGSVVAYRWVRADARYRRRTGGETMASHGRSRVRTSAGGVGTATGDEAQDVQESRNAAPGTRRIAVRHWCRGATTKVPPIRLTQTPHAPADRGAHWPGRVWPFHRARRRGDGVIGAVQLLRRPPAHLPARCPW